MNYWIKVTMCISALLLGHSQSSLAAKEMNEAVQIAGLVNEDGSVPCGQDGICNLAVCSQDPDCPKDIPSGNTTTPDSAHQHLANHPVTSPTSGKAPTNETLTKAASLNGAIYGVTIGEDTDDPCYMNIKYRNVANYDSQSGLVFSECAGHTVGDHLTASLPSGAFATGVGICLNSAGDKLKGIQLIGNYDDCILGAESRSVPNSCASVQNFNGVDYRVCDSDAPPYVTVSCSIPLTRYFERTNCQGEREGPDEDWEKIVSCPSKMVATGMKLRTTAGGGDRKMIDGVALVCDTLVPPTEKSRLGKGARLD